MDQLYFYRLALDSDLYQPFLDVLKSKGMADAKVEDRVATLARHFLGNEIVLSTPVSSCVSVPL